MVSQQIEKHRLNLIDVLVGDVKCSMKLIVFRVLIDIFLVIHLEFLEVASLRIIRNHLIPSVVVTAGSLELIRSDYVLSDANLDTVVGLAAFRET